MARRTTLDVTVCRGGRCGGPKHRGFDHDGQLDAITGAVAKAGGAVRVSDCLALCSASNVVVVRTSRVRRFFGRLARDDASSALVAWLGDGAPSEGPVATLALSHQIDPAVEFEQTD